MLAKLQTFKIHTHLFINKVNVTQVVHTHCKARVMTNLIQDKHKTK